MLQVHRELLPLFEGSTEPAIPQPSGGNFGAPFNRRDADLIIRSSDQVDFHVHKSNLGMASVVFEDMFTVSGSSPQEQEQNKPVIDLAEDSKTLHRLLTMLYPIERSWPETLEDALSLVALSKVPDGLHYYVYPLLPEGSQAPVIHRTKLVPRLWRCKTISSQRGGAGCCTVKS